jgi:hypothetical protein
MNNDVVMNLPDEIKNNKVEMRSLEDPTCGTAGCFAGLISIVANDIPELKKLYPSPSLVINISISTSIITPNRGIFPRPHLD